jgi:hypothetical protein
MVGVVVFNQQEHLCLIAGMYVIMFRLSVGQNAKTALARLVGMIRVIVVLALLKDQIGVVSQINHVARLILVQGAGGVESVGVQGGRCQRNMTLFGSSARAVDASIRAMYSVMTMATETLAVEIIEDLTVTIGIVFRFRRPRHVP